MMKPILHGIAVAAMTGLVLTAHAQDVNDQSQYPTILEQPVDQCLPAGSAVTFSVVASNVDSYQWYKNNAVIDGATNSSLTIASLTINDVAYYTAAVIKGSEAVPTRQADLNVYTVSTPAPQKQTFIIAFDVDVDDVANGSRGWRCDYGIWSPSGLFRGRGFLPWALCGLCGLCQNAFTRVGLGTHGWRIFLVCLGS